MIYNYLNLNIQSNNAKEKFLIGTFISLLVVLTIAIIINYQIGNIRLAQYELYFIVLTLISFSYYLYNKNFKHGVYSLVIFAMLISYMLLIEVGYKLALFHVMVPLNFFFLFSLKRAITYTFIHILIVITIYIYGYIVHDGLVSVLYEGNILSITIAYLVIIFFGVIYHLSIAKSYSDLEQADYQKEILLNEIHHRIKNNLQMISSMLGLQQIAVEDKKLNEIFEKNRARINSIATIHEILYKFDSFEKIQFYNYITKLSKVVVQMNDCNVKVNISNQNIYLPAEDILKLGMITNELLINSIKHAFTNKSGEVNISLYKNGNFLTYIYKDSGTKAVKIETNDTLGYKIISMMIEQLNAELSLKTQKGLTFELKIPIN